MKWLLISMIWILIGNGSMAQQLKIVDNGIPNAVIVVAQDAPQPIRHGAEEIQNSVKQISGAELSIVSTLPSDAESIASIVLQQDSHLSEEQYHLRSYKNSLTISGGGKRGVLYGCYALLEDVLGCRWYTRTISFTPKMKTIILPELDKYERPAFEYREGYLTRKSGMCLS